MTSDIGGPVSQGQVPEWALRSPMADLISQAASVAQGTTGNSSPSDGFDRCHRFEATGAQDSFIVPAGVTSVDVRMWGAGGGWSAKHQGQPGAGGYTRGTVAVTPGETLSLAVGKAASGVAGGFPGGGQGGPKGGQYAGGGGGGMSAVWHDDKPSTPTLIAGGGGGEDYWSFEFGGGGGGVRGGDGAGAAPGRGGGGGIGGAADGGSASNADDVIVGGGQRGGNSRVNAGGGSGWGGGGGGTNNPSGSDGGGGGGGGYCSGPTVTNGITIAGLPGSGSNSNNAPKQDDPQYTGTVGMGGSDGLVVIQWNDFSVVAGGPPDVTLVPAGASGYPGVHVVHEGDGQVPPLDVTVKLPAGALLKFQPQPTYLVSVMNSVTGVITNYDATVSADGQTLTAPQVDLTHAGLGGNGTYVPVWLAVTADGKAPAGTSQLGFTIGNVASQSTPINVT